MKNSLKMIFKGKEEALFEIQMKNSGKTGDWLKK